MGGRYLKTEKGQAIIEFALLLPIMLLFLGLVVDVGYWNFQKVQLQTQADAAARAGAGLLPDTAAAQAKALLIAQANGAQAADVTINATNDTLEVIIKRQGGIFFSGVVGFTSPTLTGRAVFTP
jgi:Flp pilus assembly protein TadG